MFSGWSFFVTVTIAGKNRHLRSNEASLSSLSEVVLELSYRECLFDLHHCTYPATIIVSRDSFSLFAGWFYRLVDESLLVRFPPWETELVFSTESEQAPIGSEQFLRARPTQPGARERASDALRQKRRLNAERQNIYGPESIDQKYSDPSD